eukprot:gene2988-1115_t
MKWHVRAMGVRCFDIDVGAPPATRRAAAVDAKRGVT